MRAMAAGSGRWIRDSWKHHAWDVGYSLHLWKVPGEQPLPTEAPQRPKQGQVTVVRSSKVHGERLTILEPLQLLNGTGEVTSTSEEDDDHHSCCVPCPATGILRSSHAASSRGMARVTLQSSERFQTFIGWGGSFTESSAGLDMTPEQQQEVMEAYYSKERGLGYQLGRVHMNACDFSKGNWSCCDKPDDMTLESFSISRYQDAIIPLIRKAEEAAGKPLSLLASPWSPPAWMKDNGQMCGGGQLKKECRQVWADFYVRFATEFKNQRLPLWGFTVQNEPKACMRWESCIYEHDEERDFVRDHLGPALQKSGLGLKLIVWDHNRDEIHERAKACFEDQEASQHIWGIGFHWYGDPAYEFWPPWSHDKYETDCLNLQSVHDQWPSKHLIFTEGCQEKGARIGDWALGERYGMEIIKQLNMWTEAWIDWNLILDETGGPNHVGNLCSAPVIFDTKSNKIIYQSSFYYIGHFSRYIPTGAQRIGCTSSDDDLETTAFAAPDGTLAVVVLNRTKHDKEVVLQHGDVHAFAEAPAHSITTFSLLLSASA